MLVICKENQVYFTDIRFLGQHSGKNWDSQNNIKYSNNYQSVNVTRNIPIKVCDEYTLRMRQSTIKNKSGVSQTSVKWEQKTSTGALTHRIDF